LKKNIDLVGIAYIDREIVKNKANGKEVFTVKSETRKIKFRDDNYTVDSGSRMSQIVNEIPFDADEFLRKLQRLTTAAYEGKDDRIRDLVAEIVPTYHCAGGNSL
jgi:hypothetical protein